MCAWTYTLDTDELDGSTQPVSAIDDAIRNDKKAWQERLNTDHMFELTGTQISDTDAGKHRKVTFYGVLGAKPTLEAGEGALYLKTVDGVSELFFEDSDGTEIQVTIGGKFNLTASTVPDDALDDGMILLANDAYLVASNAAGKGEVSLIKAGTNDLPTLPDGAEMASSAAPTENEGIANKKYVDDQRNLNPLGDWTSKLNNTVYEAETAGLVCANTANGATVVSGYTDAANPPTTLRVTNYGNGGFPPVGITMPVKKGDYWKVTGATTVQWIPLGQ